MIYCVFGWDSNEDSPELLEAWDSSRVDLNGAAWEALPAELAAKRGIKPENIRRAALVLDWELVENLFFVPEIPTVALKQKTHPLVALATWLESMDVPARDEEAMRERQMISMGKIIDRAKAALDEAKELQVLAPGEG